MKKILFASIALLFCVAIFAQVKNDENVEKREANNFHAIKVSHAFEVYLTQGDEESIAVSAGDKKFVNQIKTEVKDGELHVWHDGGNIHNWNTVKMKLKVYISFKELDKLDVSKDCHVYTEGVWKDENLKKELLRDAYNQ
ncbi:MAG: DUF2807 domain-containing protein [Bacteroidota bacterium]